MNRSAHPSIHPLKVEIHQSTVSTDGFKILNNYLIFTEICKMYNMTVEEYQNSFIPMQTCNQILQEARDSATKSEWRNPVPMW